MVVNRQRTKRKIVIMNVNIIKNSIRVGTTEYKYVSEFKWLCGDINYKIFFKAQSPKANNKIKNITIYANTAKEAALSLDKELIKIGLEPINILKKCK